jgi:TonB family protein
MDEAGICGCPPGGTTVAEVSERGCELATMEGLTWASLRSVVSEAVDELDECYEPVIEAHPGGAGQVTVRFIVSPQGDVFDVSIDDSSLPFDGVQRCLLDVLAPLRFAPPGGGEPILVRYPIAFASR